MSILWSLFWNFFQIGLFTIGGGYAMIPMITDVVVNHGWMDIPSVVDFIAVAESTPGPFAINIATFVGSHAGGLVGAILTTLGVVLPSFLIILLIAKWFGRFGENPAVQGVLSGLRPAVIGLISSATLLVAGNAFFAGEASFSSIKPGALFIFVALLALTKFKKVHPIGMIVLAAALGIVIFGLIPMLL